MKQAIDVLLIEDSPSQALRFQLVLQRAGYNVKTVADGDEGWQQAYTDLPKLILLDINLPTLDGFQVLARLKWGRTTACIPVIMLTRCDYLNTVERALDLGADDYLFKDDCMLLENSGELLCNAVASFLHPTSHPVTNQAMTDTPYAPNQKFREHNSSYSQRDDQQVLSDKYQYDRARSSGRLVGGYA